MSSVPPTPPPSRAATPSAAAYKRALFRNVMHILCPAGDEFPTLDTYEQIMEERRQRAVHEVRRAVQKLLSSPRPHPNMIPCPCDVCIHETRRHLDASL